MGPGYWTRSFHGMGPIEALVMKIGNRKRRRAVGAIIEPNSRPKRLRTELLYARDEREGFLEQRY